MDRTLNAIILVFVTVVGAVSIIAFLNSDRAKHRVIKRGGTCTPLHFSEGNLVSLIKNVSDNSDNSRTLDEKMRSLVGCKPYQLPGLEGNFSTLHYAAINNVSPQIIDQLVLLGAEVNARTTEGNSSLHFAVTDGSELHIRALLRAGAKLNARNSKGFTPLHIAAKNDNFIAIRELASAGADIHAETKKISPTCLNTTISGMTARFDSLADNIHASYCTRKIQITKKYSFGAEAPIHFAAATDSVRSIEVLVNYGADVNHQADNGETPLHFAATYNAVNAINSLLQLGADMNRTTIEWKERVFHPSSELIIFTDNDDNHEEYFIAGGDSALHNAAIFNSVDAIHALLSHGISVDVRNHQNYTPLHYAIYRYQIPAAIELLGAGANPNDVVTRYNYSHLHLAVGDRLSCSLSLYREILPDSIPLIRKEDLLELAEKEHRYGPFYVAEEPYSEAIQLEIIQLLARFGADVNYQDIYNRTPLHLAVRSSNARIIEALLHSGAEIHDNLFETVKQNICVTEHDNIFWELNDSSWKSVADH